MTLGVLRQQFDRVHTTVLEKEKWHEELRKWLDEVCDDEINAEDNSVEMKELMENAEDKLAWTQHWWDQVYMEKLSYEFMIDRMKKDLIAM